MKRKKRTKENLGEDLGEMGWKPLYKVSVSRSEPEAAAGYLGTFDVYDREDISLDALSGQFGGGTLRIKIKDANGRYLAHRTTKIFAPIIKVGHRARATVQPNPARAADSPELAEFTEKIASLAEKLDTMTAALAAYDRQQKRAEQLVRNTLANAPEADRAPLQVALNGLTTDLRKLRREFEQGKRFMETAVAAGMMVVLTKGEAPKQ